MGKKTNLFIGLLTAILAAVAVFVLFSTAFGATADSVPSVRGNLFYVMFGDSDAGYSAVAGLVVAFCLLIVGFLSSLVGAFMPGKLALAPFALSFLSLAAAGVLFIFAPQLYIAANTISPMAEDITLGTGCICAIVFSFAPALLSLYGSYSAFKA